MVHDVSRGTGYRLEGVDQRYTGRESRRQGACETGNAGLVDDIAQNRYLEHQPVLTVAHGLGFLRRLLVGDERAADARDEGEPPLLHEAGHVHHELCEFRQFGPETGKNLFELGYHLDEQDTGYDRCHNQDGNGVVHGALDLGLQRLGLFLVGGQAVQHGFQGTGLLARVHQVTEQVVEMVGMRLDRIGEGIARGDVVPDLEDQVFHGRVVHAVGHDVEGLNQRDAGLHHGGELACEQGDIAWRHLRPGLAQAERALLGYLGGIDTLLAQLRLGDVGIGARDFALGFFALFVRTFPGKHLICSSHTLTPRFQALDPNPLILRLL